MSLTIYAPAVVSCDYWGCAAKAKVRVILKEDESESRIDLNGLLSVKDFDIPDGWSREPYMGWCCPEHKRGSK
jgi:hypothetical protein